jgi:hypothetical protein
MVYALLVVFNPCKARHNNFKLWVVVTRPPATPSELTESRQVTISGTCDAAQFSAPSLVTAAGWAQEQGLLTWSQFDGFVTAFNEMHHLRFGTTLADLRPVKDSRNSAKKMVVPRRPPALTPYYPDPAFVIHCWDTNPKFWSTTRLRQRTCYSLHGDIIGRGGESTKAVRWGLKFDAKGVRGFLWNTKTAKGVMTPFSARYCCEIFKSGRCTPCLLLEGFDLEKLNGQVAHKHIDCSPLMDGDLPLFPAGLFLCSQKTSSTGVFRSLGAQRISKMIKRSMEEANFDPHWTSHDVRGMVASKLVNMGCPEQTVTLRARFSLETFRNHYYKFVQYAEKSDSVTKLEFEYILRINNYIILNTFLVKLINWIFHWAHASPQFVEHSSLGRLRNSLFLLSLPRSEAKPSDEGRLWETKSFSAYLGLTSHPPFDVNYEFHLV